MTTCCVCFASAPTPPTTEALTPAPPNNTAMIIGLVVGLGVGLFLLITLVGGIVVCYLCLQKKKNYRKYVLPYRVYMDGELELGIERTCWIG